MRILFKVVAAAVLMVGGLNVMLAASQGHDAQLVDPQSKRDQRPDYARNAARAFKPELFVAVGICTHLGCSPSKPPAGAANSPSRTLRRPTER